MYLGEADCEDVIILWDFTSGQYLTIFLYSVEQQDEWWR
jgi:hypothetical protein